MNHPITPAGHATGLMFGAQTNRGHFNIDSLCAEICDLAQCHKDMVEVSTLGMLSLAIQDFITVEKPGIGVGPVSLFVINVADSGERKSTLLRILLTPFRAAEAIYDDEHEKKAAFEYEVKRKIWAKKAKEIDRRLTIAINNNEDLKALEPELLKNESMKPVPTIRKRWIYSKATTQAIFENFKSGNKSIGLIDSDASGVLLGKTFSDPSLFNVLWDGDAIEFDKLGKESMVLSDSRLSICFGVQKQFFKEFCEKNNSKARNVGFIARALLAVPPSIKGEEFLLSGGMLEHEQYENYKLQIQEILLRDKLNVDSTGVMTFDDVSQSVLQSFKSEMILKSVHGREVRYTTEFISRAVDMVSRIAAVRSFYHTAGFKILVDDLHYAIDLFRRQINVHSQWVDQYLNEQAHISFAMEVDRFLLSKCESGRLPLIIEPRWLYANYTDHSKRGRIFLEPQFYRLLSEKRITLLNDQKSKFVLNAEFFSKMNAFMPSVYRQQLQCLVDSNQLMPLGSVI